MSIPIEDTAEHYRRAPWYDLEYAHIPDISWIVNRCRRYGADGPVLEMACGTGRLTFPIAQAGVSITGVDLSDSMLGRARAKLSEQPALQHLVRLEHGDMRTVDVGYGTYSFVFVPFNSFMHLGDTASQLAALHNCREHLAKGAYFMADIFVPNVARLATGKAGTGHHRDVEFIVPEESIHVQRWADARYEETSQVLRVNFVYRVYDLATGLFKYELLSSTELRMIFPAEWELLLKTAGLKIVERIGGYENQPFGSGSGKMLFLCQKD